MALEFQRYGRNKDTSVNKTYINSGEYRRKFDNATDNPNVNKALYDCAKKALLHRSGTLFEDMFWLDAETGEVIFAVENSTIERTIYYSQNLSGKIKAHIAKGRSLVTIHTHPSSLPPSVADFNSNFQRGYTEGFIACHDGRLIRYSSDQEISELLYDRYLERFIQDGYNEYEAQFKTLEKLKENHLIEFEEVFYDGKE